MPFKRSFYDEPGLESRTDDCLVYAAGEDCAPWNTIATPAPRGHKAKVVQKGGGLLMKCMLDAVGREGIPVLHRYPRRGTASSATTASSRASS